MSEDTSTTIDHLLSTMEAFEIVKDKFACSEHPGEYQWCWVEKQNTANAEHIPLCFHDIQMWAKYLVSDIIIVFHTLECQFPGALIGDPPHRHFVYFTSKY
jgi:hypothetical protein